MSAAPRLIDTGMTDAEWQTRCGLAALCRMEPPVDRSVADFRC